jgi:hypothetical protein
MSGATTPTIGRVDDRAFDARELVIVVTLLVGISRLVEPPGLWLVAGLLLLTTAVWALQLLAAIDPAGATNGVPIESLLVPAATAFAAATAIRLVPVGLWLVPGLVVAALLLRRTLTTEAGLLAAPRRPGPEVRLAVLGGALVVAFFGFLGVAAAVPGGLPEPGESLISAATLPLDGLAAMALADGFLAALLGYRAAALRSNRLRDVAWAALSCGLVVAISAAAFRAMALPRLLGPALLVIVLYLWDAAHAAARPERRDARRIWEAVLLAAAAVVAIAWSLNLRT